MAIYITSDLHLFHTNAMGPDGFIKTRLHFKDVGEMNKTIINAINTAVKKEDVLIHCGDFGFEKPKVLFQQLESINAHKIILIKGNHDSSKFFKYIEKHNEQNRYELHEVGFIIKANKKAYHITHYPLGLGENRKVLRNLCGHIHEEDPRAANCLNIGIDSPSFPNLPFGTPVLIEDAFNKVEEKWSSWEAQNKGEIKE